MPRTDRQAKQSFFAKKDQKTFASAVAESPGPPVSTPARQPGQKERQLFSLLCYAVLAAVTLGIQAHKYPDFTSFWAGLDQHRYLEAAQAWAAGDLNPARHHYLPFYPLLGAAFAWLTPWQPFLLPDLACLLASLAIFQRIASRLAPGWPPVAAALCFTVAVLSSRTAIAIWVIPWSTTGSAPFQFLAVLLALRFAERPSPRRAGLFALSVAAIAGFRPSDAAVLLATGGAYAGWALLRARTPLHGWTSCAGAGLAGLLLGALPAALAHFAVFGLHAGPYIGGSASIGLEWRLLPMRWVMIVIGPRPLLPEGTGLAAALPWVAPGLAGLILTLFTAVRRGPGFGPGVSAGLRPAPGPGVLVAATVALHWALYLAYRDLQPYGLWRFYNVHYFKWTFPFLVLWAAQLGVALVHRPRRPGAIAACVVAALALAWRPALRDRVAQPAQPTAHGIAVPAGAFRLDRALQLNLAGDWRTIYFGDATLQAGSAIFHNTTDFKLMPTPGGALLLPLRPLPDDAATLTWPDGLTPGAAPFLTTARQGVVFGLPCVVLSRLRPACSVGN